MGKIIGVDLGTNNTRIYSKGKGILLKEPSLVAVHPKTKTVLAAGESARELLGKTPEQITVVKPLSFGVITDFDVACVMLKLFLENSLRGTLFRPQVAVCVPSDITEVERRVLLETIERAGGKGAYVLEAPMAAAIGAGLSVEKASGNMIVDIGGGTMDAAVVSFGGIVISKSIREAGNSMDEAIRRYVKEKYGVLIGLKTAENLKISIGAVHSSAEEKTMCVMGRDISSGLPKTVLVTTTDVREAILEIARKMVGAIKILLEKTPPELVQDIVEKGIVLSGGGAKTAGLALFVEEATGICTHVAENAEECAAIGVGTMMDTFSHHPWIRNEKQLLQSRG